MPALLSLSSANNASAAFTQLNRTVGVIRTLSGISAATFLAAYIFAPDNYRHPYLIWSTLFVTAGGFFDLLVGPSSPAAVVEKKPKDVKGKKHMEASYELLGDTISESGLSDDVSEEAVNGEELRSAMVGFGRTEKIRYAISSVGFVLSLVGLWGDGPW